MILTKVNPRKPAACRRLVHSSPFRGGGIEDEGVKTSPYMSCGTACTTTVGRTWNLRDFLSPRNPFPLRSRRPIFNPCLLLGNEEGQKRACVIFRTLQPHISALNDHSHRASARHISPVCRLFQMAMLRPLLVAALASGAEAFAPAYSVAGLPGMRLSRSAVSSETRPSLRTVAAGSLKMQLGLNDKSAGTSVDEFRKDGKVRQGADGAGGVGRGRC